MKIKNKIKLVLSEFNRASNFKSKSLAFFSCFNSIIFFSDKDKYFIIKFIIAEIKDEYIICGN